MTSSHEIIISKASRCSGVIEISGAKNAALPLMAACLLTDEEVFLENVPNITDVDEMKKQLESYGVRVGEDGSTRVLEAAEGETTSSPGSRDGSNMRGSFLVLGPLLARFRKAKVYKPGGCQIGGTKGRPVDYYIDALKQMGATTVEENSEYVSLKADQGLHGAQIDCKHSVGATETVIMAACLAVGQTVITNAAVEPEIMDLTKMLRAMGMNGKIQENESEKKIVITGNRGNLNGCTQAHEIIPDRIEAGTWAIAAAMTGSSLLLKMNPKVGEKIMVPVLEKLKEAGVGVEWSSNGLEVRRPDGHILPVDITAGPFPQFPTDLLPQWVTFMTQANGPSELEDTIYDSRFKHVEYLKKMGAKITRSSDRKYQVHGNAKLRGTHVVATDLRAGAALILAALVAKGTTVVKQFQHVLRGYENIEGKLDRLNVQFSRRSPARAGFHGGNSSQVQ